MKDAFDIFAGTEKNGLWLETVEGLSNARERLQQIAAEKPGQYFLFCAKTHSSVCEIETFSIPRPRPMLVRTKANSSAA
jgi:hypothetical protein